MKRFLILVIAMASILTGCSTVQMASAGSNQNIIQTNVNLSSNNFRVVGTSSGTVTYTYFLGFGGPTRNAAVQNATSLMIKNAGLAGSQAIANVCVDDEFKVSLLLFSRRTITVTGQIIEFK